MRTRRFFLILLLLIPFVALLGVVFYDRIEPQIVGFPFFYIWLLGWIVATSVLTWFVNRWWR